MECNNLKVLFYEWSDVNRQPIGFLNNDDFLGDYKNLRKNVSKHRND